MPLTNATIDGAWTLQSKNTALQGRLHDGGFWMQNGTQNTSLVPNQTWRSGVVPTSSNSSFFYDFVVAATATPSLSLLVYPGTAIISRAANAIYQVFSSAIQTVTVADADPTNPRLDAIVVRVEDTAIGDSNLRAQIQVITGTPAPSPTVPAIPAGGLILATARVNALATTITSGQVADQRKSAALNGAIRRLLAADSLSDPGFHDGEIRDTGTGLDRWTDSSSSWVPIGVPFASATPRGVLAEVKRATTDNVTSEVVLETATVNVVQGRRYRLTWSFNWSSDTAAGPPNSTVNIRTAAGASITTSSTLIRGGNLLIQNQTAQATTIVGTYVATATGQQTFGCTATSNGTPVLTIQGITTARLFLVEDVGV